MIIYSYIITHMSIVIDIDAWLPFPPGGLHYLVYWNIVPMGQPLNQHVKR